MFSSHQGFLKISVLEMKSWKLRNTGFYLLPPWCICSSQIIMVYFTCIQKVLNIKNKGKNIPRIKDKCPCEHLTISLEFLSRILSQNGNIAGGDLNEGYASLHHEYRAVSSPIQVTEKSMKVIIITFYWCCAWNSVLYMQSNKHPLGHNFVFGPERGV